MRGPVQARCPSCGTIYEIDRSLLRQARGLARCYHCNQVFNALENRPVEGSPAAPLLPDKGSDKPPQPLDTADLPFRVPDDLPALQPSAKAGLDVRDTLHPTASKGPSRWTLLLLTILLAALVAQVAWLQREHWIYSPLASQICTGLKCPPLHVHRPEHFSVVQRGMTASPGTPPALHLQLSFRNDADHPLPLPRLQLSLLDGNGSLVGRRSLEAAEYLPSHWVGPPTALSKEVITIELIFEDPGPRVRSYVFDFV